jgi:hypothetical protein
VATSAATRCKACSSAFDKGVNSTPAARVLDVGGLVLLDLLADALDQLFSHGGQILLYRWRQGLEALLADNQLATKEPKLEPMVPVLDSLSSP